MFQTTQEADMHAPAAVSAGRAAAVLEALLLAAVALIFVEERWAWAAFQAGLFALAAAWAAYLAWSGRRPVFPAALALPAVALAAALAQLALGATSSAWRTGTAALDWFTWLTLAWLGVQWFGIPPVRRRFLRAFAAFACALSIAATLQLFSSGGRVYWLFPSGWTDGVPGPFLNRNQYAAFLELALPVALWSIWQDARRSWLYILMAGVMFASVVAAASRAGAILTAAEMIAVCALARRRGLLSRRAPTWAIAAAAAFTAVVGWDVLWAHFQQPDPYAGRREMLLSSLDMIRARPWTGFGLGAWATAYPAYARYDDGSFVNQAHNDWAQWGAEGGLPVLAALAGFALLLIAPAVRSLWGMGTLAVLLHGLVDYPLQQRPALGACFFALASAVLARDRSPGRKEPAA